MTGAVRFLFFFRFVARAKGGVGEHCRGILGGRGGGGGGGGGEGVSRGKLVQACLGGERERERESESEREGKRKLSAIEHRRWARPARSPAFMFC